LADLLAAAVNPNVGGWLPVISRLKPPPTPSYFFSIVPNGRIASSAPGLLRRLCCFLVVFAGSCLPGLVSRVFAIVSSLDGVGVSGGRIAAGYQW
jgi:hypothetical protein